MVKLFCAIVGDAEPVFPVDIESDQLVGDLKKEIKKRNSVTIACDADKLELSLAKTEDGKWLPLDKMLQNKYDFSNMKKLRGSWKLNKENLFGPNVSLGKKVIHVLVVVPKQDPPCSQIFPPLGPNADGLNLENPHLPRVQLVQKLFESISDTNFVLLLSPAGSGKTSLLTLLARQFPQFSYIPISFRDPEVDATTLLNMQGIDLVEQKCRLPDDRGWIFLLDDCQQKFGDVAFWYRLVKTGYWIPKHVRFIISATHLLEEDSPASLARFDNLLWKLRRNDFLISDDEAHECLKMKNGLPTEFLRFTTLLEVIVRQCNGHIGALRVSINGIREHFKPRKGETCPSEHEVLAYFLSDTFVKKMARCFGSNQMVHEANPAFLSECLLSDPDRQPLVHTLTRDELECFKSLQKSGIVTDVGGYVKFTSPMAERYYYQWLGTRENPTSMHGLVRSMGRPTFT